MLIAYLKQLYTRMHERTRVLTHTHAVTHTYKVKGGRLSSYNLYSDMEIILRASARLAYAGFYR